MYSFTENIIAGLHAEPNRPDQSDEGHSVKPDPGITHK